MTPQHGGDVVLRPGKVSDELEQSYSLRHAARPASVLGVVLEAADDVAYVPLFGAADLALYQLVDGVQGDQGADRLVGKVRPVVHEHLVDLADDRAVAPPDVPHPARLVPDARHDVY